MLVCGMCMMKHREGIHDALPAASSGLGSV